MDLKRLVDHETGESLDEPLIQNPHKIPEHPLSDAETGEPEINLRKKVIRRRVRFQIPKNIKDELMSTEKRRKRRHRLGKPVPTSIGTSFGRMNPICLFLPGIIYYTWFTMILMAFEVVFHRWTHHKNKSLKDTDVYYRSPFYGITAEFCALCQDETRMDRVGKMQQIRLHKFLKHYNYIKRAVT